MANKARLNFFGGSDTVTGSNFMLEASGLKILVDCGLFQGFKYASESNRDEFPYDAKEIDYLFVTHAHIDHIGRVPKLIRDGFKGKIYSTPETKLIAGPMFQDALSLMRMEEKGRDLPMIYTQEDIDQALSIWETIDYNKEFKIKDLKIKLFSAGHILGSAMISISDTNTVLFSGDLGNKNNLLLNEAEIPTGVDYLLCESVYGDRNHEEPASRKGKLVEALKRAKDMNGTLIIPAFSLERTQHLLFEINNLVESGEIEPIPLYLDSPLAIKLTEIYRRSGHLFKDAVRGQIESGDDIFDFPKLQISVGREDSQNIWSEPSPKVILAGSGMSMGGRVIHHEKLYLNDPSTTILFVGYQSAGSLGRRIAEGEKKVTIEGEEIEVRAKVMQVEGYSSHRDSDGLVEFVSKIKPKRVFVVMGEPKTSTFLAQRIREELEIQAQVPEKGSSIEIDL